MNKGFTLIEILAVIIILSALTLVTVVSIKPIVKDAKKGLSDAQIENIKESASLYYIKHGMGIEDLETSNSKYCVNVSELIESGYIENNEVTNPNTGKKVLGSVKITYKASNYIYEYQDNACTNYDNGIICERVESTELGNVPEGNFIAGDAYNCKVDPDSEPYKFYILTTPDEDSDIVNLIMDRNMCSDGTPTDENKEDRCLVAWWTNNSGQSTNVYGPVTAMDYLYNATKSWINIPNIEINYTDEGNAGSTGYGTIKTTNNITKIMKKDETAVIVLKDQEGYSNLKSRLPYKSEISNYDSTNKTNAYLYDYLDLYNNIQTNKIDSIYGYWTLSSGGGNVGLALLVHYQGYVHQSDVGADSSIGVRPVISVYKTQMK